MEKPTQVSYTNQLFDALSHTVSGAVAGAGLGKAFYPLQVKEGALFGAALNTVTAGAQKLASVVGIEENFVSKAVISAATLAGVFFAMTQPSAAPLLGRVGLDFAKDAIMKFCAASFVAELVLGAAKAYITSAPSIQDEVDALPAEEVKEAFEKWAEKTAKKDDKGNDIDPEISTAYQPAFVQRFAKDGLYATALEGFKKAEDVTAAPEHIIVYAFTANPEIKDAAVKAAVDARIGKLPAVTEKPDSKEAAQKLDTAVVRYAFEHYTVYTKDMKPEVKAELDAKIIEVHAKRPEDKDAASKMSREQLAFIYANFAEYTKVEGKDMDAEIITALEEAIVKAGVVAVTKPADKDVAAKLSKLEVRALHAKHEAIFGKKPDFKDVDVIKQLNIRYGAIGLAEQTVPTKPITPPAPKGTVAKLVGLWRAYAPTFAQNHEGKIATVAALATAEGLSVGFEALTGINVPYNGF